MTFSPRLRTDRRYGGWKDRAACRDQDPLIYDTDDDPNPHPDIRCMLCAVRPACLTYALNGQESGTWGGLSRKQREKIQSRISHKRKLRSCPVCGNTTLTHDDDPGMGNCPSCGFTWRYVETSYGDRAVTAMRVRSQPEPVSPSEV